MTDVREYTAAYAWVAEPRVEGQTAKLFFFEQPDFHLLDEKTVDQIVDRVRAWYDVIARVFTAKST